MYFQYFILISKFVSVNAYSYLICMFLYIVCSNQFVIPLEVLNLQKEHRLVDYYKIYYLIYRIYLLELKNHLSSLSHEEFC
jgi:hypothetical protein